MEKAVLLAKNPWWKGKHYFEQDEDYRRWKQKKIRWIPELMSDLKLKPFSLNFIFGPRQSGKTTVLKLKIKDLLFKNIKPEQIFYFRCDNLKDYKELDEVISLYLDLRKELGAGSSYIFLDEITFADEWYRTIKSRIDAGDFKNDVLVITGSASFDILKHAEYFPGRRGKGRNYYVFPVSFRKYIEIMDNKLHERIPECKSIKQIKKNSIKAFIYLDELQIHYNNYLKTGGFPLAINFYPENKTEAENVYLNWIKNDIARVNKDIDIAREILKVVLTKIPSTISWEKIAKETSIKSPRTIYSYLNIFEKMFVLLISYFINPSRLTTEFAKNKKIHLIDPFMYEILENWCLLNIKNKKNKKSEDVVAVHLHRFAKKNKLFSEKIFYWKNSHEIDNVLVSKEKAVGFEVKWANNVKPVNLVVNKLKEVYVLSKTGFVSEKNIIPISVFLSLLDIN
ncbi:AAA family ATPase [Candidatus Woesearchaeota archaeon]|nr:AAA family ATPase [Candidatus Woesearchaeota archaeon]